MYAISMLMPVTVLPGSQPNGPTQVTLYLIIVKDVEVLGGIMRAEHVDGSVVVVGQVDAGGDQDVAASGKDHQVEKPLFSNLKFHEPSQMIKNKSKLLWLEVIVV